MRLGGRRGRAYCLAFAMAVATAWAPNAYAHHATGHSPSPYDVEFEGESMDLPPGQGDEPIEPGASGGRAQRIWSPGTASTTVTTTRPSDHLFVRARGDDCIEAPRIRVVIDDVERYNGPVSVDGYKDIGVRLALRAGSHEVEITFLNDYSLWVGSTLICDRNVLIDHVTVVATPFSATGWRNQPLPDNTAVAEHSAAMVADIQRQITENMNAPPPRPPGTWVSTGATATIYTVGPAQPTVRVDHTGDDPSLQAQWEDVPLPPDAKPSDPPYNPQNDSGGDANLVVWQPSSNTLWEFFHLHRVDGPLDSEPRWAAGYGGRMQDVSTFEGQFEDPPGPQFGSSATSLAQLATLSRIEEVKRGVTEIKSGSGPGTLDHAIGVTIKGTQGYDGWCWPANRTDPQHWSRSAASIPAGTRFRLPASFDLELWQDPDPQANDGKERPLTNYGLMLARTIQRFGMVVSDSGQGIGFGVEDPAPLGTDPFYANGQPRGDGPFEGRWPDQGGVLANVPWSELVALAQPPGEGFGCTNDLDVKPPLDN